MTLTETLSTKQYRAIAGLLTSRTLEEVAEKAGVSRSTIMRWLKDEHFKAALAQAEAEALAQAARLMAAGTAEAVEVLLMVIRNPKTSEKVKVAAARAYLANLPKVRLLGSIEQALNELTGGDNDDSDNDA